MIMSDEIVRLVLGRISFPGISFVLGDKNGTLYLQVRSDGGRCNVSGAAMAWSGRKWMLSRHMTVSEIVQTAFKAVMTALEHEARENFKYRGAAIFGPHFDVERLVSLAADESATDVRGESA